MIAIIRREESNHVPPEDGCPACGELHVDHLIWQEDPHEGLVRCVSCGCRYSPDTPVEEVAYSAWDGELIQRLVPATGPPYERYCSVGSLEAIADELRQCGWSGASEADLIGALEPWGISTMECRAALGFLADYGLVEHDEARYRPEAPDLVEAALTAYPEALRARGGEGWPVSYHEGRLAHLGIQGMAAHRPAALGPALASADLRRRQFPSPARGARPRRLPACATRSAGSGNPCDAIASARRGPRRYFRPSSPSVMPRSSVTILPTSTHRLLLPGCRNR